MALFAALSAGLAIICWPSRSAPAVRRLHGLRAGGVPDSAHVAPPVPRVRGRALAAVGAGGAIALIVGLPWGAVVGAGCAVACHVVLGRLEPSAVRTRRRRLAADVPVTVDLMAACLRSGSTPVAAAEAVARAVGGPVGDALHGVVALLRLGGDPAESWTVLAKDEELTTLGRAMGRAMSSGAPASTALDHVATEARERRRLLAEEAARKVGVRVAAPLGLCFLPAFVLLGVVPVVAGIASTVELW